MDKHLFASQVPPSPHQWKPRSLISNEIRCEILFKAPEYIPVSHLLVPFTATVFFAVEINSIRDSDRVNEQ